MSWKWQDNIGANVPCPLFTFWKMRVVRSNTHCLLRGPGYEVKIFWMYVSCNIWFHSASFRATLGFKKHPSSTFTSVYHLMCVWGCYSAIKNKKKVSNQAYTKGTKKKKKKLLCFSLWRWRLTTAVARLDVFAVSRVLCCAKRTVVGCGNHRSKSFCMRKSDSVTYRLRTFTLNYMKACVSLKFHARKQKLEHEFTWDLHLPVWIPHFHMHDEHS